MTRLTNAQKEFLRVLAEQPKERLYAKTLKADYKLVAERLVELGVLELGVAAPPGTKWLTIYRRKRALEEDEIPCE